MVKGLSFEIHLKYKFSNDDQTVLTKQLLDFKKPMVIEFHTCWYYCPTVPNRGGQTRPEFDPIRSVGSRLYILYHILCITSCRSIFAFLAFVFIYLNISASLKNIFYWWTLWLRVPYWSSDRIGI